MQLPQLKRIRWAVRATLMLGVAASVAANILHADNNPISQAISAWPPLALLLTVELTSRIPMHKKGLAALRILATGVIAGIAAWVSYWHMQGVALFYGEEIGSSYLLPVSVDGLIVVASVSLVELAGRIRLLEEKVATAPVAAPAPVQFVQPMPVAAPVFQPAQAAPMRANTTVVDEDDDYTADEALTDLSSAPVSPAVGSGPRTAPAPVSPAVTATTRPAQPYVNGSVARAAVSAPARTVVTAPAESSTPRQRRPVQETAELAAEIEAMHPGISSAELARRLGISEVRLRAVRREAALARTSD